MASIPAVDDETRTLVRSGPVIIRDPVPSDGVAMPQGWHVMVRTRGDGGRTDRYFLDPTGRRYASRNDVRRALGLPEVPGEHGGGRHTSPQPRQQQQQQQHSPPAPPPPPTPQQRSSSPHRTSRVGPRYQARVADGPDGAEPRDPRDPDILSHCLAEAPSPGMARAVVCEPSGTRVWSPDVLPLREVDDYLARARELTSPFARFDAEAALMLLASNNFDVALALHIYAFEQTTITQSFTTAPL